MKNLTKKDVYQIIVSIIAISLMIGMLYCESKK